jgi:hypothetical protein
MEPPNDDAEGPHQDDVTDDQEDQDRAKRINDHRNLHGLT